MNEQIVKKTKCFTVFTFLERKISDTQRNRHLKYLLIILHAKFCEETESRKKIQRHKKMLSQLKPVDLL